MSPRWTPDDSLFERNAKGEINGVRRVRDALRKRKVSLGNRVITSRDSGMEAARNDLKRTGMPSGVEQWQIPIALGDMLSFTSHLMPGAKVPSHSHNHATFRIVIEGSLKCGEVVLKAGDWMLVPPGHRYALEAGPDGCEHFYHHMFPPIFWPWLEPVGD